VWPGSAGVTTAVERAGGDERDVLERYLIIPSAGRPTFLLPLESSVAAGASLRAYNRMRPPAARAARWMVSAAATTGLAPLLLRDRLYVRASSAARTTMTLTEYLAEALGVRRVSVSARVFRRAGRKPTLQVFSERGEPLAYVKVGWDERTRALVRNEARALEACAEANLRIVTPRLMHVGEWDDRVVTATSPLPENTIRFAPADGPPPLAAALEIASLVPNQNRELSASPWWASFRARVGAAVEEEPRAGFAADLLARIEQRAAVLLRFGSWHGDWTPWNLGVADRRLVAWDWEEYEDDAPVGFDHLHFVFHAGLRLDGLDVSGAMERCRTAARDLERVQPPEAARILPELYLLEAWLRFHRASRSGTGTRRDLIDQFATAAASRTAGER